MDFVCVCLWGREKGIPVCRDLLIYFWCILVMLIFGLLLINQISIIVFSSEAVFNVRT